MASTATLPLEQKRGRSAFLERKLKNSRIGRWGTFAFGVLLVLGIGYIAFKLTGDQPQALEQLSR